MQEAIIQVGKGVVLINVFTVTPDRQQELIEAWQRATEDVMRHEPGFVSANLHRSLDGTKVINYAQWQSLEAFNSMRRNPAAGAHMKALFQIGSSSPIVCEVVSVHTPQATGAEKP